MSESTERRHISTVPRPHRRYFEENPQEKRQVTARVSFFHGTGAHFHVELTEEPNYVYSADLGTWIHPQGDSGGEGRHRFMKFRKEDTARRWIHQVFNAEFSDETHRLVLEGDVSQRWFYPEGD